MHTVMILSEHYANLLKEYQFLFKPFINNGTISFCEWNESGTDLKSAVPDLYKLIKGKLEWRAIILGTGIDSNLKDPNNPFDFVKDDESQFPKESQIPIVRLSHMLGGYPDTNTKHFEEGYEYIDSQTGELKRVLCKDIDVDWLMELNENEGDTLKSIYIEVKMSEEAKEAREKLIEKYEFKDTRPSDLILITTKKVRNTYEDMQESWQTNIEMNSSNFCARNMYPSFCRFLTYRIINAENSLYTRQLFEFWLAVLTVAVNSIPASVFQAYRLYDLNINIDKDKLSVLLNEHLNRNVATQYYVTEQMNYKTPVSFDIDTNIVEYQNVPVILEEVKGSDLFIKKYIGLSRDCPEDELSFWIKESYSKKKLINKFLKSPRRALEKSSMYLKTTAESFYGDEYELDQFQIEDLKEQISELELNITTFNSRNVINEIQLNKEFNHIEKDIKKEIANRMTKRTIIIYGTIALLVYFIGFIPYLFNSFKGGVLGGLYSLLLIIISLFLVSMGGIISLYILKTRLEKKIESFNDFCRYIIRKVNESGKKFETYFTQVCTYMKAQSIVQGTSLQSNSILSRKKLLKLHLKTIKQVLVRDEELLSSYGLNRDTKLKENVTSFFNETVFPKNNSIYYFPIADREELIPVNETGDFVKAPYSFVNQLNIDREIIYDDMRGDDL